MRLGNIWRGVVAFAMLSAGCARIAETTTFTHTPVSRRSSMEVVPDSLEYGASTQLQGRILLVAVHRTEVCRTTVVPVLRKEAHIKREVVDSNEGRLSSPVVSLLAGLASIGFGAYMYADAERLAASSSNTEESTPDDYRGGGLVLGGAGAGLLGIALIDALRLRDVDGVVGQVDGEPEVSAALCRRAPAGEVAVRVEARSGTWVESARTDAAGKASIDLLSLAESAFTGGSLSLQLSVGEQRQGVDLAAAQAEALLALLSADSSSRVSQDRERKRAAECESKVASARASAIDETSTDEEVADAERAWQRAEEGCGERWRQEDGKQRDELRAKIASTASARASHRCQTASERATQSAAQRFEDDEPLQVDALYESVDALCKGAPNGAAVIAAWGRKKVLVAAAEELDLSLASRDAVALRAQLRDAELAAAVRREGWLLEQIPALTAYWLGVMEAGGGSDAARRQLCASRALYLSFVGKAAWAKLRAEVARRNDVMKAAQLIRLLDGGGCT